MADPRRTEAADMWGPFRFFFGEWSGNGEGEPGISRSDRDYSLVLHDRFIQIRNRAVYEPQEKNPEGEVHEDLGLLSFDKRRGMHVLREFHVEGFVNQYLIDTTEVGKARIVMTSEAIENIAPGWRARTTYEILSDDEFREEFDLAGPGKDWEPYSATNFKRSHKGSPT
jgi:hypothetical protein